MCVILHYRIIIDQVPVVVQVTRVADILRDFKKQLVDLESLSKLIRCALRQIKARKVDETVRENRYPFKLPALLFVG